MMVGPSDESDSRVFQLNQEMEKIDSLPSLSASMLLRVTADPRVWLCPTGWRDTLAQQGGTCSGMVTTIYTPGDASSSTMPRD